MKKSLINKFITLVRSNNLEKINEISKNYPNIIFSKNENGHTPLHIIAETGKFEILQILMENIKQSEQNNLVVSEPASKKARKGKSPNSAENKINTKKSPEKNLDIMYEDNMTPLHVACLYEHIDIVKILVENGANINIKGKNNLTPLNIAIYKNSPKIIAFLIENLENLEDQNIGIAALIEFTIENHYINIIQALNKKSIFPVKYKFQPDLASAIEQGDIKLVQILIEEKGAKIDVCDEECHNGLHIAVLYEKIEMAKFLINYAINKKYIDYFINANDIHNHTPLYYAIKKENLNMIRILIEKRADINMKIDNYPSYETLDEASINNSFSHLIPANLGWNPVTRILETYPSFLYLAVKKGKTEIAQILSENGANLSIQNKHGRTPLIFSMIIGKNMIKTAQILIKNGAILHIIHSANELPLNIVIFSMNYSSFFSEYTELMKLLLNAGANPNMRDNEGNTALFTALGLRLRKTEEIIKIVKILLNAGADPTMQDNEGNTALFTVLNLYFYKTEERTKIVEILLNAGANPNIQNNEGNTILFTALGLRLTNTKEVIKIVEILLNAGADPNIKNKKGEGCLYQACINDHLSEKTLIELVQLLLNAGADKNYEQSDKILHMSRYTDKLREVIKIINNHKNSAKDTNFITLDINIPSNLNKQNLLQFSK